MDVYKYVVVLFVVIMGFMYFVFNSLNLFVLLDSEIDHLKRDKSINIFIYKLITDAEIMSLDVQNQVNIIKTEVIDISNSFSDKFTGNVRIIFRRSERLIRRMLNFKNSYAECAQKSSYKIFLATNDNIVEFIKCKLTIIEDVLNLINDLSSNYNNATVITKKLIRELQNCSMTTVSPESLVTCKLKLSIEALQEYSAWRDSIKNIIHEAVKCVQNLKIKLATCKIITAINVAKNSSQIIADAAECLRWKNNIIK